MTTAEAEGRFVAPIAEVWAVVGDFVGLVEVLGLSATVEGEGIGALRTVVVGGDPIVERLVARDEDAHRLVYAIVSGAVPVADYEATMELTELPGGGTELRWWGTFEPAVGVEESDAIDFVARIYRRGIRGLQGLFGDPES